MRNEEYIILHSRNNIITLGQEVVWIDGAFSLAAEPFQFASVQPIGTSFEVESIEKKKHTLYYFYMILYDSCAYIVLIYLHTYYLFMVVCLFPIYVTASL